MKVDVYITENQFIAAKFSEKKINEIFKEKSIKLYQGRIQGFWKGVALYVDHHGWPGKKLDFRWFKKAEIMLETISFGQKIPISIFKFSQFLSKKSYQFLKIH